MKFPNADQFDRCTKYDANVLPERGPCPDMFVHAGRANLTRCGAHGWAACVRIGSTVNLWLAPFSARHGSEFQHLLIAGQGRTFGDPVFPGSTTPAGIVAAVWDAEERLHVLWGGEGGIRHAVSRPGTLDPSALRKSTNWKIAGEVFWNASSPDTICDVDDVLASPDGTFHVVFSAGGQLHAARWDGSWEASDLGKGDQASMARDAKGRIHVVFRRDNAIHHATSSDGVKWSEPRCVALAYSSWPTIAITNDGPLIAFRYEGVRPVSVTGVSQMVDGKRVEPWDTRGILQNRLGLGHRIGAAIPQGDQWKLVQVAECRELVLKKMTPEHILSMRQCETTTRVEEFGPPMLTVDGRGAVWLAWANNTRKHVYYSRWLGDSFTEMAELRGPVPGLGARMAFERTMPASADEMGMLFFMGGMGCFDRVTVPKLSTSQNRRVQFLDLLDVAGLCGLQQSLNVFSKHSSNPVLPAGKKGEPDSEMVVLPWIRWSSDHFHLTYQGVDQKRNWTVGLEATSPDMIRWTKLPKEKRRLERHTLDGIPFPEGVQPVFLEDKREKNPKRRFKGLFYAGYFDIPELRKVAWCGWHRAGCSSPDALNWKWEREYPLVYVGDGVRMWEDPNDIPERRFKAGCLMRSTAGRACSFFYSADLLDWKGSCDLLDRDEPFNKPPGPHKWGTPVLEAEGGGPNEDETHGGVFWSEHGLWFGFYEPWQFDGKIAKSLAVSRDGINFSRVKRGQWNLPVGAPGEWDSGRVVSGSPVYFRDEVRVLYTGCNWKHGLMQPSAMTSPLAHDAPTQLGLASMRRDAWTFLEVEPRLASGTMTTIPIEIDPAGKEPLCLNVEGLQNAESPGEIRVELLDAQTLKPLPGFSVADAVPVREDGFAVVARWKQHSSPSECRVKATRLRFHLKGNFTRLYAFGFGAPNYSDVPDTRPPSCSIQDQP